MNANLRAAIRIYRVACADAAGLKAKFGRDSWQAYSAQRYAEGIASALRCLTFDLPTVELPEGRFK